MGRERQEMQGRVERERAALEARLRAAPVNSDATGKPPGLAGLEGEIATTLRVFQDQLRQQQESLQHMQAGAPGVDPMNAQVALMQQQQRTGGAAAAGAGPGSALSLTPQNPFAPPGYIPPVQAPTAEEIAEYAVYLGMDPVADKELLYIAEWALTAPLPDGWTEHNDAAGSEFYFNAMTGHSTYEHPLDDHYRNYDRSVKAQRQQ